MLDCQVSIRTVWKERNLVTAQIDDLFRYQDVEYSVSGISEEKLFHPSLLGLRPVKTSTGCWRGYQAVFAIADSRLVLHTLHVNLFSGDEDFTRQEGPPVNGISPTGPLGEDDRFNNHYVGVDYHLEYTGGLLLARGFIDELYVHMGFHPAWKYTNVIELVFRNGVLDHEFDRSEQMAEIRQHILDSRRHGDAGRWPTEEEIRLFDRTYRM